MDVILISIIIVAIIFFVIIGYFIKRYKHHHKAFHESEIEPVFTELTTDEPKEKIKKHKVLGHEKIKKLIKKKR